MSLYGTNIADGNTTTVTMAASTTVEGAGGTEWLTEVAVGDIFKIESEDAGYVVASITDDDTLELTESYGGTTGSGIDYVIIRDFTDRFIIPLINRGDLDWPDIYSTAMRKLDGAMNRERMVSVAASPHTALITEDFFAVNTSSAREIDLLSAVTYGEGRRIIIKDATGTANTYNITIDPNGTETIDGGGAGAAITISNAYGHVELISDGVNLFTLSSS